MWLERCVRWKSGNETKVGGVVGRVCIIFNELQLQRTDAAVTICDNRYCEKVQLQRSLHIRPTSLINCVKAALSSFFASAIFIANLNFNIAH